MVIKKSKKIPSIFLACALLFTAVFSCSVFANATSDFTPRLEAPSADNRYYFSDDNIFYRYGYGMPNCTAYAFGRAYEILGEEPNLCHYDASEWYNFSDGYQRGQEPKVGAIACWTYYRYGETNGHVAVVEKIEDGEITLSNSAWGWENFYLTHADVNDPSVGESDWNFQGYIYIGDFEYSGNTTTPSKPDNTYAIGVYKVQVSDSLNMRSDASTSSQAVAQIYNNTELYITQIKNAGGYTWGYTTYNGRKGWVALNYCVFIKDKPDDMDFELGDVNMDGEINVLDVTALQLYISGCSTFNAEQKKLVDINTDGKTDVVDVTMLQTIISERAG